MRNVWLKFLESFFFLKMLKLTLSSIWLKKYRNCQSLSVVAKLLDKHFMNNMQKFGAYPRIDGIREYLNDVTVVSMNTIITLA